ncbi:PD-(D/E)XK nuclease family protein [Streptomyces shenzhenensis]|uniref:PD-(D/E)XK nuclease family protein n=1 Tax=Streptomyces shenzhenensis TaxID=943815 RepID=UPI001F2C657E|nr:PD-(D/E)XK nuclease family protein [Streptomyces shenzhenensis]
MGGALKVRPDVRGEAWQRRWDDSHPFLLGIIREIACAIHDDPRIDTWHGMQSVISERLSQISLHPATRRYAEHAIAGYLEAHDALSAETPGLKFRSFDPKIFPEPGGTLWVWGPLYEDGNGIREVRKMRFGSVREKPVTPEPWTAVAAHVASLFRPTQNISRIRVVEIGLEDSSFQVLFDENPEEARSAFTSIALPNLHKIIRGDTYHPGSFCKDCKIAGSCSALEKLDGFLGQSTPGSATRSVSARDIELYKTCPAQWFITRSQHLPQKDSSGPASHRGRLVHGWIAKAHSRSVRCTVQDIGSFDDPDSFTSTLSPDEYAEIQPFLAQHVEICPVRDETQVISIEAPVYGYDALADVIIVSAPDMIYVDADDSLVIRETKTTSRDMPQDDAEAFDQFFAVAWLLSLFASGYRGPYQSASARLELEVITSDASRVFEWDLKDKGVLRMAQKEVRRRVKSWHGDVTWAATPGRHCTWCPVRGWCPEAQRDDESNTETE